MIKVNVLTEENSWLKKIKTRKFLFNKICRNFPKRYKFAKKSVYNIITFK